MPESNELNDNKISILVVDDDNVTRLTINKILEKSGYAVSTVSSGRDAVSQCQQRIPDLIVLDVIMPEMDGYETCIALRKIANYNQLPILMLTGLDDMESIDKAFQAGATDFITKPLNWPLLTQRVKYALRTKNLFKELTTSQLKLSKAQNIAKISYWEFNPLKNIIKFSTEAVSMLGLNNNHYNLSDFLDILDTETASKMRSEISQTLLSGSPYSFDHKYSSNDSLLVLNQHAERSEENNSLLLVGTFQDITERVEAEQKIYFHRYFDEATSLPNNKHLLLKLSELIDNNPDNLMISVLSITFDKVRNIGTSISNSFVSNFLKQAAIILQQNLPDAAEIARISPTSLGLLLPNLHTIDQLENICDFILTLFRHPIEVDKDEVYTTLSIGITIHPFNDSPANLINNAITAQKHCINEGGSKYLFYHKDMNNQTNASMLLENKMRKALTNNEFYAFYQPQINTVDNSLTGMEALARWITPDGQFVYPDIFIPVAEESEMIIELGRQILFQACHFSQKLLSEGLGRIRAGVNLSALQFSDPQLIPTIKRTLDETGLPPELLEIEITESIAMTDINHAISILNAMRSLGIKTSMDDFGTGYSSLSYLQQLPLDTLKIDQSFIKPITKDGQNSEIARAIIAMGHSLGMHLIAEGAEEKYHYELLKDLGCHEVQGYYFSRPVADSDFIEFINNHKND